MNSVQVIEAIELAFAGVSRDPEQSLHQAQLLDQGIGREILEDEWKASGLLDSDMQWHEVPDTDLQDCPAALSHLTPVSWRYYLAAYMRLALKYLATPLWKVDVPHWVLHTLTYDDSYPGMGRYNLGRFETLDRAQFEAVQHFLLFTKSNPACHNFYSEQAAAALNKYWGLSNEQRPNRSLQPTAARGGR